jgi:hypothetical protein
VPLFSLTTIVRLKNKEQGQLRKIFISMAN